MTTVAELIVAKMKQEGIQYAFGLPGSMACIDLMDAMDKEGIRFILTKQETAADMMAAVYGELTGKPGIALSAISPGLTAAVNGLAYAYVDRAPLIHFSDAYTQGASQIVLRQKTDHRQIAQGVTKWSTTLSADWAHQILQRAFRTTLEDRPGPVHVDIPDGVAKSQAPEKPLEPVNKQVMARVYSQEPEGLRRVVDRIKGAEAPVILAGVGVRWDKAYSQVQALAERIGAPVFTTAKMKGIIPEDHPYSAGTFIGGKLEMEILGKADLILGIGVDPGDMLAKPWKYNQPMILVDRVTNFNEVYHAEAELVGNVAEILTMLTELLPSKQKWEESRVAAYRQLVYKALALPSEGLGPCRVFEILRERMDRGDIITSDSGMAKFLLLQIWKCYEPETLLMSGPLGTMGLGVPAAIVAKLLNPDKKVVAICGDGGFAMRLQELETAMALGVAPIFLVMNDRALAQIRVKQGKKGLRTVGTSYPGANYGRLAEVFGGQSFTVSTESELSRALDESMGSGAMSVIDCRIDTSRYPEQFDALREV